MFVEVNDYKNKKEERLSFVRFHKKQNNNEGITKMKTVKNYSPQTKILSLVLSFLIIFYLTPASVYAEGLDGDTTVSDNSVPENEENNTYIPEIYEVTELREENVKHFRLADGSYVAAQYNYPIHYTDENGEFEDIDNRLVESGTEFSTNNSRVKFIKKITGNGNIFTLHENNTKITMGLLGAEKKTKGVVTSNHNSDDAIDDTLGKMTNLENISSTIGTLGLAGEHWSSKAI